MRPLALCLLLCSSAAFAAPLDTTFAWVPADVTTVSHMRGDGMILLNWLDGLPSVTFPCYAPLRKRATGLSQIQFEGIKTSVLIFEGDPPRADVERCTELILDSVHQQHVTVRREKDMTLFEGVKPAAVGFLKSLKR